MQPRTGSATALTPAQLAERTLHRRAVETVIWAMPAVNAELIFQAMRDAKADFNEAVYWSRPVDWKNQTLTPNPDTIYLMPIFNTKEVGPMVLEIPPADGGSSIIGSIDEAWQTAIEDVGPAGVDKGTGGKYLILPPGYKEPRPGATSRFPPERTPASRYCAPTSGLPPTRTLRRQSHTASASGSIRLAQAANPPETQFVDARDVVFDSTIPYDLRFFEALNRFVQREPWFERDKAMIESLQTIGIEKVTLFHPDAKSRTVLTDATREAHAWLDYKYEDVFAVPFDEGAHWALPASPAVAEGLMTNFANRDAYPVESRGVSYSMAYFSAKHLGEASIT